VKVAHLDTGRTWRGGQQQVLLLLQGLRSRGVETQLLAPPGSLLERAGQEGLAVAEWRSRGEWDLGAVSDARRRLESFRPDVVHLHSAHAHTLGAIAARLAGGMRVVVSRRVDFAVAATPWSWLKYRFPVDRYFCISHGVMDVMRRGGVNDSKLALVPSGVRFATDDEVRAAPDLRAELSIPRELRLIGTVAALAPHKNHADLMRAAARVCAERADVRFVWLGEGECRAALEAQRRSLGLETRVLMPGFRAGARACIPQFAIFALASYLEGLCTSIIDAQSLGTPVVATRTGGIPDLIRDGENGRLVPPRDPESLAAALLEALDRPGRAAEWAARAQETVKSFSADHMVERSLEEYRRLAGTGTHPKA
jgi:glycosyltransferase involved in cell wall biosynthesis